MISMIAVEVKKHNLSRFLVMVNRNFISAIVHTVLTDSTLAHFSAPKWLIYALVQSTWNHESNERNR